MSLFDTFNSDTGGLCDGSCERNPLTCDIGFCKKCRATTSSGMRIYCHSCASEKEVCAVCGKDLMEEVRKKKKGGRKKGN